MFKDFHLQWSMILSIISLPLLRLHTCGTINPILNIWQFLSIWFPDKSISE